MSLEDQRREQHAARGKQHPAPSSPSSPSSPGVEVLAGRCEYLGKAGEQLPGCKCKDRPRVYECGFFLGDRAVQNMPPGCQLAAIREHGIRICSTCHVNAPATLQNAIRWQIGITASRRPFGDTLGDCLEAWAAAGWPAPIVYADGDDVELHGANAVVRRDRAGALPNFYAACADLLMRDPEAVHMIVQDDTTAVIGLREYLEAKPWPAAAAIVKLFTADGASLQETGWQSIPADLDMRGAQCIIFPRGRLAEFLASWQAVEHRLGNIRQLEGIDNVVARWARQAGPQYWHVPSLVEHHGTENSTLDHRFGRAAGYPGDNFDATRLAQPPMVAAIMVTRPERYPLAVVAMESLFRQTHRPLALIAVTPEGPTLKDYWHDHCRPLSFGIPFREIQKHPEFALGTLRNAGIDAAAEMKVPLCIQWDDDDYSLPTRIAEQLAAWRPGSAVFLTSQLRSDLESGQTLTYRKEAGIEGTILHPTETPRRYLAMRKQEDTQFFLQWSQAGKAIAIQNDPRLYIRHHHGANTWDRGHIMQGMPASQVQQELADNVALKYRLPPLARYWRREPQIHGWSSPAFIRLLLHMLELAETSAPDVLDIGVHHGRVTLAIAAKLLELGQGGKVYAVDLWPHEAHRAQFDRHREALDVGESLRILLGDSAEVLQTLPKSAPYRMAHVDGAHDYEHAAGDIAHALEHTDPGGIIAIDDVHNPAHPEVAPAFWQVLAEHDESGNDWWQPFAVCSNRWLLARPQHVRAYHKEAARYAKAQKLAHKTPTFRGEPLLVIE